MNITIKSIRDRLSIIRLISFDLSTDCYIKVIKDSDEFVKSKKYHIFSRNGIIDNNDIIFLLGFKYLNTRIFNVRMKTIEKENQMLELEFIV